jgi:hypothetical protein
MLTELVMLVADWWFTEDRFSDDYILVYADQLEE